MGWPIYRSEKPVLELKLFLLRCGNQVLEFPFQT
jgi:hypothetical protein